jgi:hypothetical protein
MHHLVHMVSRTMKLAETYNRQSASLRDRAADAQVLTRVTAECTFALATARMALINLEGVEVMIIELGTASVETKAVLPFPQEVFDPTITAQKPYQLGRFL